MALLVGGVVQLFERVAFHLLGARMRAGYKGKRHAIFRWTLRCGFAVEQFAQE